MTDETPALPRALRVLRAARDLLASDDPRAAPRDPTWTTIVYAMRQPFRFWLVTAAVVAVAQHARVAGAKAGHEVDAAGVIAAAADALAGPRQDTYGDPADTYRRAAVCVGQVKDTPAAPMDVVGALICVKWARAENKPDAFHLDNYVDLVAYLAILRALGAPSPAEIVDAYNAEDRDDH